MYLNAFKYIVRATVWDMFSLWIGIKMSERLRFSEAQSTIPNDSGGKKDSPEFLILLWKHKFGKNTFLRIFQSSG